MDATIHELTPIDARGAHIIAAFPSVGLVATIAANFLIEHLGLEQVGIMDGDGFPTISVVQDGEPLSPVRVYAGTYETADNRNQNLIVFLSEFQPQADLVRPVAQAILEFARVHGAEVVISPEGLFVEGPSELAPVHAIGSTEATRQVLRDAGVPLFQEGIVAGVTGVLLNMGKREGVEVIGILSEARKEYPDARSAASVVEIMCQIVDAAVNTDELLREADDFEVHVQDELRRRLRQEETIERGTKHSVMYG